MKTITTIEELEYLYNHSAMTWEDLREEDFELALSECGDVGAKGYIIKGGVMNKLCKLTGENAYPEDLNIFAIDKYKTLAMLVGARWMDDIIDNNANREDYHPFRDLPFREEEE